MFLKVWLYYIYRVGILDMVFVIMFFFFLKFVKWSFVIRLLDGFGKVWVEIDERKNLFE